MTHTSWKVMEFKKGIFQAWQVVENDCGHGKSCNSTNRSLSFFNRMIIIVGFKLLS